MFKGHPTGRYGDLANEVAGKHGYRIFAMDPIFAGGSWLAAYFRAARSRQFSGPKGAAHRILGDDYDRKPKE